MKIPLLITRTGIIAFKIAVIVIVLLAIIPLISGGISIDLENTDEGSSSMEDDVITFEFPVTVSNNGFYAINDLTVTFALLDDEGEIISRSTSDQIDIPAGGDTDVVIRMSMDIEDIRDAIGAEMVFNGTELTADFGLSAKYVLDMVRASIEAAMDIELGPFIYNINVDTNSAYVWSDGSNYTLTVPYSFNCDDMVTGEIVQVTTVLSDAYGIMGQVSQDVVLQEYTQEFAEIPISYDAYQRAILGETVTATVTISYMDISATFENEFYYGGW